MKKLLILLSILLALTGYSIFGNNSTRRNEQQSKPQADTDSLKVTTDTNIPGSNPDISDELKKLQEIEKQYLASNHYTKEKKVPLTISKDLRRIIAFKVLEDPMEEENSRILIGMPRQRIELFIIDRENNSSQRAGVCEYIVSHAWSEDGRLLSLVSQGTVNVLDVEKGTLREITLKYENDRIFNTNWGFGDHKLCIHLDVFANYYIYDYDEDKVTKVRGQYQEGDTVPRGYVNGRMLSSKGHAVGVAQGLYMGSSQEDMLYEGETVIHDTNGGRVLIFHQDVNNAGPGVVYTLEDMDTSTGEKRKLLTGGSVSGYIHVYKASYIRHTGDIIYTTFEAKESSIDYKLIRIRADGSTTEHTVPSPLYTLTPGEHLIHFAVFEKGREAIMDTSEFKINPSPLSGYKNDNIRKLMIRALKIYSADAPDLNEVRRTFINSYDPIPQEALENILLDMGTEGGWRFTRQELNKYMTISCKLHDNGNRATVILEDSYFWGPHELVKISGNWYITGFSTWYGSKERDNLLTAAENYVRKTLKTGKATVYADVFSKALKIEVGEVEFWAMSDPHRAIPANSHANFARIKLGVTLADGTEEKYQLYMEREHKGALWRVRNIGHLSPTLFPKE